MREAVSSCEAARIARALKGRRDGTGWMARCPAHDDVTPSLSVDVGHAGRTLVHCHAGCDQRDVIEALVRLGLWRGGERIAADRTGSSSLRPHAFERAERSDAALSIWRASGEAVGTLVEAYLRARAITVPVPPNLRFHPRLKHPTGDVWPAMTALVQHGGTGAPMAVHRTFLARDGRGKAPVSPARLMLGPCRGGAVRLGEAGETLMVGEGIETCLSAMQATGTPAWAALSTSGLRSLDLPLSTSDVIVLADGDEAGEAAAKASARRWSGEGRRVRIARPPRGLDFNDLLMACPAATIGGAA